MRALLRATRLICVGVAGISLLGPLSCQRQLTKADAKSLIEQRQQLVSFENIKIGAMAQCRWKTASGHAVLGIGSQFPTDACMKEISASGLITNVNCAKPQDGMYGKFRSCAFDGGPNTWVMSGIFFGFQCGTQSVGDVVATFTQTNQATVQFMVERTIDGELLKKIADCDIEVPKEREQVETKSFHCDDDGNWSVAQGETLGF